MGASERCSAAVVKPMARGMLVLTAIVAALGGLLFGYDTSVISGAMLSLRAAFRLTDPLLEFAVSIVLAWALVGSAVAGYSVNTIIYYSPGILRLSGYPSAKVAILPAAVVGLVNVLVTVVAILLIDRLGRRFLLLLATARTTITLGLTGAAFSRHSAGVVVFTG